MEENITIYISESNKGEEQIIINKQYKFNFSHSRIDNSRVYKCTKYKKNNKCKSLIILNNEKEILKYESLHNHPGNEYSVSLSVMKHKIKDEIKKHSNPFDIKRKSPYNEISKEMGFIYPCPEYISVKTLILRSINKKLPSNVTTFNEIPNETEYYKTERNEDFMIFKNSDLVIFQSPFQAKLFKKYLMIYFQQVFITRTYVKELNSFYTTSYAILRNKKQKTYKMLFNKLKQNSNNNIITEPKNVHCDFEKGISKAVKKIFPNINIKYCIWHYKNLLEIKKNELCRNEVNDDEKIFNYYKGISNLPFINPEYIMDIFSLIKTKSIEKNSCQFLKFLEYFYETYLIGYDMKSWNYYNNIEHITNNASESLNNSLNKLFPMKPNFYELINKLKEQEHLSYYDYQMKIKGIWRMKKKIKTKTDEINILIDKYKNKEAKLINIKYDRSDLTKLWFECLTNLNNIL
ncbi:hypothetical protein H8356DRAFT_1423725 [Neocallimastix lanati (nom. inval.)]|nr:hypothetical protein H8356DRAFT_1423725 [Neocallimastix sp. JGI-2020a]